MCEGVVVVSCFDRGSSVFCIKRLSAGKKEGMKKRLFITLFRLH